MSKRVEIKAFQAVSADVVVKQFLSEPVFPDGWFATAAEALAAFKPEQEQAPVEAARKPGRPRKAQ